MPRRGRNEASTIAAEDVQAPAQPPYDHQYASKTSQGCLDNLDPHLSIFNLRASGRNFMNMSVDAASTTAERKSKKSKKVKSSSIVLDDVSKPVKSLKEKRKRKAEEVEDSEMVDLSATIEGAPSKDKDEARKERKRQKKLEKEAKVVAEQSSQLEIAEDNDGKKKKKSKKGERGMHLIIFYPDLRQLQHVYRQEKT